MCEEDAEKLLRKPARSGPDSVRVQRLVRPLEPARNMTFREEWRRWLESEECQLLREAATLGNDLIARDRYLENRLWFAFSRGWEAAEGVLTSDVDGRTPKGSTEPSSATREETK